VLIYTDYIGRFSLNQAKMAVKQPGNLLQSNIKWLVTLARQDL